MPFQVGNDNTSSMRDIVTLWPIIRLSRGLWEVLSLESGGKVQQVDSVLPFIMVGAPFVLIFVILALICRKLCGSSSTSGDRSGDVELGQRTRAGSTIQDFAEDVGGDGHLK